MRALICCCKRWKINATWREIERERGWGRIKTMKLRMIFRRFIDEHVLFAQTNTTHIRAHRNDGEGALPKSAIFLPCDNHLHLNMSYTFEPEIITRTKFIFIGKMWIENVERATGAREGENGNDHLYLMIWTRCIDLETGAFYWMLVRKTRHSRSKR